MRLVRVAGGTSVLSRLFLKDGPGSCTLGLWVGDSAARSLLTRLQGPGWPNALHFSPLQGDSGEKCSLGFSSGMDPCEWPSAPLPFPPRVPAPCPTGASSALVQGLLPEQEQEQGAPGRGGGLAKEALSN